MAVGGELHADQEAILLARKSKQEYLCGINLYPGLPEKEWIEFDSMINIGPAKITDHGAWRMKKREKI